MCFCLQYCISGVVKENEKHPTYSISETSKSRLIEMHFLTGTRIVNISSRLSVINFQEKIPAKALGILIDGFVPFLPYEHKWAGAQETRG